MLGYGLLEDTKGNCDCLEVFCTSHDGDVDGAKAAVVNDGSLGRLERLVLGFQG